MIGQIWWGGHKNEKEVIGNVFLMLIRIAF